MNDASTSVSKATPAQAPADVSVVIPTYNRPGLLVDAIESILAQTRRPREIIVVDNGVEALARDAAAKFGGDVVYIRQNPMGIQAARNAGAEAATSGWVAMLDDDDLYDPGFFAAMAEPMADPRVNLIFSNFRKFHPDGPLPRANFENAPEGYWDGVPRPAEGGHWSYVGKFPVERVLKFIAFFPSGMVIRKPFFQELGGYDPGVPSIRAEDIEFLTRVLSAGQLALVWPSLVHYRLHAQNASGASWEQAMARWMVFEYVSRKNQHGSAALSAALEKDLPGRRARAFDHAFGLRDFETMFRVAEMLRPEDWTAIRRVRKLVARLPRPVAAPLLGIQRAVRNLGTLAQRSS